MPLAFNLVKKFLSLEFMKEYPFNSKVSLNFVTLLSILNVSIFESAKEIMSSAGGRYAVQILKLNSLILIVRNCNYWFQGFLLDLHLKTHSIRKSLHRPLLSLLRNEKLRNLVCWTDEFHFHLTTSHSDSIYFSLFANNMYTWLHSRVLITTTISIKEKG